MLMDLRINLSVPNKLLRIITFIGFLLSLLGFCVLLAWVTGIDFLITLHPDLASMVFNTALGVFFSGLSFISLVYKKKTLTYVFAGIVTGLGFLTIFEYIFSLDLGIDEMFVSDHLEAQTSYPGRMAPNTALSFILSGFNLLLANAAFKKTYWISVNAILATLISVFGLVALYGYLNGVENTYGWGKHSQMAVHTASSFICIGLGQFIWSWYQSTEKLGSHYWLPIPVVIFFLSFAFMLWNAMVLVEYKSLNHIVENEIKDFSSIINNDVNKTLFSLERIAQRWEDELYADNPVAWKEDLQNYLQHYSELKIIAHINNQFKIDAVFLPASQETDFEKNIKHNAVRAFIMMKTSGNSGPVILPGITELEEPYLSIYVPVYKGFQQAGFIFSVVDVKYFIEQLMSINSRDIFAVSLKDDENILYQNYVFGEYDMTRFLRTTDMNVANAKWRLTIALKEDYIKTTRSDFPEFILVSGVLAAFICAFICWLLQQFIKKNNELKISNDALQQFSYRTSHDLKSPLTTIKGLAKFIKMDIESGNLEEALDNTNKIANQAIKLENLVTNILELAKAELLESNNVEVIDLAVLIEEILEQHAQIIKETSVKVSYDIDSSFLFASEKTRVNQILENIIVNGIKYSDPTKTDKFVKIKASSVDGRYSISVEDNGLGILEKDVDKIFTIFTRLHPKAVDGSGMGLYIVKRHVDKLKGEIKVSTTNNKTSFEIKLPNKEKEL
tara:strand:- start:8594 stop:10783 length:2190 start_codon:yes stop_codon:yes gene_type:complete